MIKRKLKDLREHATNRRSRFQDVQSGRVHDKIEET